MVIVPRNFKTNWHPWQNPASPHTHPDHMTKASHMTPFKAEEQKLNSDLSMDHTGPLHQYRNYIPPAPILQARLFNEITWKYCFLFLKVFISWFLRERPLLFRCVHIDTSIHSAAVEAKSEDWTFWKNTESKAAVLQNITVNFIQMKWNIVKAQRKVINKHTWLHNTNLMPFLEAFPAI